MAWNESNPLVLISKQFSKSPRSLELDTIRALQLYTRGSNNTYISSFADLTSDGLSGTYWSSDSTNILSTITGLSNLGYVTSIQMKYPDIKSYTVSLISTLFTSVSSIKTPRVNLIDNNYKDNTDNKSTRTSLFTNGTISTHSMVVYGKNTLTLQGNFLLQDTVTNKYSQLNLVSNAIILNNSAPLFLSDSNILPSTINCLGNYTYLSTTGLQTLITKSGVVNSYVLTNTVVNTVGGNGYIDAMPYTQSTVSNLIITAGFLKDIHITSTAHGLGTLGYISSVSFLSSIDSIVKQAANVTDEDMASTVVGLGTIGYISSLDLGNIFILGSEYSNYPQYSDLTSTIIGLNYNYIETLDIVSSFSDISSNSYIEIDLISTLEGLGTANYISSFDLISTFIDISNNLIHQDPDITSTLEGLGGEGYISTVNMQDTLTSIKEFLFSKNDIPSTVAGLGTIDYISTLSLTSTVNSIMSSEVFYKSNLTSTLAGLNINITPYISTSSLRSTVRYFTGIIPVTTAQLVTTVDNLAFNQRYVSSTQLESTTAFFIDSLAYESTMENTIDNLAFNQRYISSFDLASTFTDISNNFILITSLPSTITNLGVANYVSSFDVGSTIYGISLNIVTRENIGSTLRGLGTADYISTLSLQSTLTSFYITPDLFSRSNLTSTVRGLGTANYISTLSLTSTVRYFNGIIPITTAQLVTTIDNLGFNQRYISSAQLESTTTFFINSFLYQSTLENIIDNLGFNLSYISSLDLASTFTDISNNIIAFPSLASTVINLGLADYVSSFDLTSTIYDIRSNIVTRANIASTLRGLGTADYISTLSLQSTITSFYITPNLFSRSNLTSTVRGLNINPTRYISTSWLVSTVDYYAKITPVTTAQLDTTVDNLAFNQRYVSSAHLESTTTFFIDSLAYPSTLENTIDNLGFNRSYISSLDLASTFTDISNNLILIPSLPSTVINLGLADYVSSFDLRSTVYDIGSNIVTRANIASTVRGLGTADYISTLSLQSTINSFNGTPNLVVKTNLTSTVRGLGTRSYISSLELASNVNSIVNNPNTLSPVNFFSAMTHLGSSRYISSQSFLSTFDFLYMNLVRDSNVGSTLTGLGTRGYISSLDLVSTINFISLNYPQKTDFTSTQQGLATFAYISSLDLASTVRWLQTTGLAVQSDLISTVRGVGTADYISSFDLASTFRNLSNNYTLITSNPSTVIGIGSANYISSVSLASTNNFISLNYPQTINLTSTQQGLYTFGYISSLDLGSTMNFISRNYPQNTNLASTLDGLTTLGYISSLDLAQQFENTTSNLLLVTNLRSTVSGLGSVGYISTLDLNSTLSNIMYNYNLPENEYIKASNVISSIRYLGSISYISTLSMQSTVSNVITRNANFVTMNTVISTINGLSNRYMFYGPVISNVDLISTSYGNFSSIGGVLGNGYAASNTFEFNNNASNSRNPNMVVYDTTTAPTARRFMTLVTGFGYWIGTVINYNSNTIITPTNWNACIISNQIRLAIFPYKEDSSSNYNQPLVWAGSMFMSIGFSNGDGGTGSYGGFLYPIYSLDGITFNICPVSFPARTLSGSSTKGGRYSIKMTYNPNANIVQFFQGYTSPTITPVDDFGFYNDIGSNNPVFGFYMRPTNLSVLTQLNTVNSSSTFLSPPGRNNTCLTAYGFNGICQVFAIQNCTVAEAPYVFVSYDGIKLIRLTLPASFNNPISFGITPRYMVSAIGVYIYVYIIYGTQTYPDQFIYYRTIDGVNWESVSPSVGSGASGYSNFYYNGAGGASGYTSDIYPHRVPVTNLTQQTPFGYFLPFGYTSKQGGISQNESNQSFYISATQDLDLFGNRLIQYKPTINNYFSWNNYLVTQPSVYYINNIYFIFCTGQQNDINNAAGVAIFTTPDFFTFSDNVIPGAGLGIGSGGFYWLFGFATNYDALPVSLQASNLSIYARNMQQRIPSIAYTDGSPSYTNNYIHATNINVSSILNFNDALFVHGTRNSVAIGGVLAFNTSNIYVTPTSNTNVGSNTNPYGYFSTFQRLEVNQVIRTTNDMPLKPTPGNWFGYSDENVKTNIVTADLERCYQITSTINLLHYRYISSLETNFTTPDTHMLGYIAQDVAQVFPKSVKPYLFNSTSILSLDITQVQMAQYGATQYMISSIQQRSTLLESQFLEIQTLSGNYSTLLSLYNM